MIGKSAPYRNPSMMCAAKDRPCAKCGEKTYTEVREPTHSHER